MSINTSNEYIMRNQESLESKREVVNTSSNFRQGAYRNLPGINADGGLEYNLVYRSLKFPQQINFDQLVSRKEVLHELLGEFKANNNDKIIFEPHKKEEYSKRLFLLQQQIDGLMRQSFLYSGKSDGKVRTIDYNSLIVEKQNQVNQLQRKIANLEAQIRIKDQRQRDLQSQLEKRFALIKTKNDEIQKLRSNSKPFQQVSKSQMDATNNYLLGLTSKLDQLYKRGVSLAQLEKQVEGWIFTLPNESQLKRKLRSADEDWLQDKYKRYVNYLATQAGAILNNMGKIYTSQIDSLKLRGNQVEYDNRIIDLIGKEVIPRHIIPTQDVLNSNQVINSRVGLGGSGTSIQNMGSITNIIRSQNFNSYLQNNVQKVVQIPVQDTRTKALIYKLATQMRRLCNKYPSLAKQISPQLSEYFSQQLIQSIEVDQIDRLVEIVKYVPEVVKVENVYTYNRQKNRKAQFHLRVLIKALLEEMQRMRIKTGVQPQIDEGVIGMIRQQIIDLVDVDDILKVYRTVPKIVQVEKVVEQVVEKLVPVPHFVEIKTHQQNYIELNKVQVVKQTVNVPLNKPQIEKLVEQQLVLLPEYKQKVVVSTALQQNSYQTVTQIPKVRQVEKVVGLPQESVKIVEVPGPERIVEREVQKVRNLIQEKIVIVEKEVEKIVEVVKIVQKIVTITQEIPKIVQVQKIVEKIVRSKQYVENVRVENYVVEKPVEVICYVDRIIPVERIIQKLVPYPQIIEKIVTITEKIQIPKYVEIIKEVPIFMTQIKVVERFIEKPVPGPVVEVAKAVDRIVEVPIIQQKVRVQTEYRKEPVIEKQYELRRQPVNIEVPVVLYEERVVEVPTEHVRIIKQEYPKEVYIQKAIPIQTIRQQIIQAPCIVEKIVQKLVEVPKIVEIERIVEKIVPVPRIVERIVEVQKIVQRIVERIVEKKQFIQIVMTREVPYEVQRIIQIDVPRLVIQNKEVPRFIDRDKVVTNEIVKESVRVQNIEQPPRVTIQRKQTPIEIVIQKLVPLKIQEHVYVELKQQIVVPVQVPIPKTLIQQKIIPVEHVVPVVHEIQRNIQRAVQVKVEMPGRVEVKDRNIQKLFVQKDVMVVNNEIPYYNERIVQVDRIVEKPVAVERIIKEVVEVPYMVEKIVKQIINIPKVQEVQRIVEVPIKNQQIITVDRIVPKIITLNKAFAQIVDKLHEFPRLAEQMKKVTNEIERIVPERYSSTQVKPVEILVQKVVIEEKMKQVDKYISAINQSLKIAEKIIERPSEPILIVDQKILQVPVIIEKIVEKIIIMPQVVQILKYIHQITDNESLGVALSGQIGIQQAEYQRLGKRVNGELGKLRGLLTDLKKMPQYKDQITIIENFLAEFNKFIVYPRIRQIMTEKVVQSVVQKDKIVRVPTKTSQDERKSLASAVLIDKLVMELKRFRQASPGIQLRLDPDIVQIFGEQLQPISNKYGNNYNQLLEQYSKSIYSRFNMYGTWTVEHQKMLKQFIEERFELANRLKKSSKDSIKYKELYNGVVEKYSRQQKANQDIRSKFNDLQKTVKDMLVVIVDVGMKKALQQRLNILTRAIFGYASGADTITYQLKQMSDLDKDRANRYLRQKDAVIAEMRNTIDSLKKQIQKKQYKVQGQFVYGNCNLHTQIIGDMQAELDQLRRYRQLYGGQGLGSKTSIKVDQKANNQVEVSRLQSQISRLKAELSKSQSQVSQLQFEIRKLRQIQMDHQNCQSKIRELQQRLRIIVTQSQRYQRQLMEVKNLKETGKRTATQSAHTPNRESMSESYGVNYHRYIGDNSNSSEIRKQETYYEKNVFRSGGNYGPIGSQETLNQYGKTTQSMTNGGMINAMSVGGRLGNSGTGSPYGSRLQGSGHGSLMGRAEGSTGGLASSSSGKNIGISSAYIQQQRSNNYLTDSRGSGAGSAFGTKLEGSAHGSGTGSRVEGNVSGLANSSSSKNIGISSAYIQQQRSSNNYLTDSRGSGAGSGASGGSGLSRGDGSNRSSKNGGNYQQSSQKEGSLKNSGVESIQMSAQKYMREQISQISGSSSKLYGTSQRQVIKRTINRDRLQQSDQ